MMRKRPCAAPECGRRGERVGDPSARVVDGVVERSTDREPRRDRGGERASSAVEAAADAPRRELAHAAAVPEDVHRIAREVTAGDERGSRAVRDERARRLRHRADVGHGRTDERLRFREIRSHERRAREQHAADGRREPGLPERLARRRDQHGVDDERKVRHAGEPRGDRFHGRDAPDHAGLRRGDRQIAEHRVELRDDERRLDVCAVSAVTTLVPHTPNAAKVFRSAWIPAAPPGSEPAIVSATGAIVVG